MRAGKENVGVIRAQQSPCHPGSATPAELRPQPRTIDHMQARAVTHCVFMIHSLLTTHSLLAL